MMTASVIYHVMNYTTQMDAARKGIVTKEMQVVAAKEFMPVDALRQLIANGEVVIPANKNHTSIDPEGVGKNCRTKINVNLGVSKDHNDYEEELDKVRSAIAMDFGYEGITVRSDTNGSRRHGQAGLDFHDVDHMAIDLEAFHGPLHTGFAQPVRAGKPFAEADAFFLLVQK